MKSLLVANLQTKSKYGLERFDIELKAQIENSLQVGWKSEDIILATNFDYEFMGVKSIKLPQLDQNKFCLTGSKMFAIATLLKETTETIWAHDLDCWQNAPFECPEFKDVGICTYSTSKLNGGSIFWKPSALDIAETILKHIIKHKAKREEPTLNKFLKNKKFKERVTILNNTFNVGCSGFKERFRRSKEHGLANSCYYPLVTHQHPTNRISWDTMCRDRNRIGEIAVNKRLYELFLKYFGVRIKLFTYPPNERGFEGDYQPPFPLREDNGVQPKVLQETL